MSSDIDDEIDKLIDAHLPLYPEDDDLPEFKAQLKAMINKEVVRELQRVLDNSSGGGNWRRNIITIIAQLIKEKG